MQQSPSVNDGIARPPERGRTRTAVSVSVRIEGGAAGMCLRNTGGEVRISRPGQGQELTRVSVELRRSVVCEVGIVAPPRQQDRKTECRKVHVPKRIVIYGNGQYARLLHQMMLDDGRFEIAAFAADEQFITQRTLFGLSVVEFENVDAEYPADRFDMMVAIGAVRVRDRKRMFDKAKSKGYRLANYVAARANTYSDLVLGENNIVFTGAYLGPGGRLGDNNMIRPNCYVGHDFRIGSHNYIAPGCNIAGCSSIGDLCYIGIGTTTIQGLVIADETLIGAGSLVLRSTEPQSKYYGSPARKMGEHPDTGILMSPVKREERSSTPDSGPGIIEGSV